MTIKYITSKSPLFMVKAGLNLDELPSEQEWKENLDKVSLMKNRVREIPSSMSPNCQILSTLFLQDNPLLESIPESFFFHMHGLKILNLSRTGIESLPNSISELTNLTALLLQNCGSLKHVPSLARLRALVKLELGYTAINEVPAGMEMLANLTSLDLLCLELHMIPAGIFSKLCRLQKLQAYWGLETQKVAVEEAATLKKLDRLLAQFHNLQDFNCYAKSLNSQGGPNEYRLFFIPLEIKFTPCEDQYEWNQLFDWTLPYELNKEMRKESFLHRLHLTKSTFPEDGGKHWSGTIQMLKLSYSPFVRSGVNQARVFKALFEEDEEVPCFSREAIQLEPNHEQLLLHFYTITQTQFLAIIHYATSHNIPEMTHPEIRSAFDVVNLSLDGHENRLFNWNRSRSTTSAPPL
ncbi:hypothetical protein Q3G72_019244 [Acer saccharum]|nr:hypothetical protein Q3G72_019244 [Acer saccharum]